ncbi:MAG: gamma-glutamylcyclotransferase family protein [Pseudomonadota bacterium]
MRLFFFGSLMDGDLLRLVLDREIDDIEHAAAEILGYERRRAKNESFPIIVPTPGGRVEGRLVTGLTATDVARIQWYESDDYALKPCLVKVGELRREAHVFLATESLEDEGVAWDFEHWVRIEKPMCLTLAREIMSHFGKISGAELVRRWPDMKARALAQHFGEAVAQPVRKRAGGRRR